MAAVLLPPTIQFADATGLVVIPTVNTMSGHWIQAMGKQPRSMLMESITTLTRGLSSSFEARVSNSKSFNWTEIYRTLKPLPKVAWHF